MIDNRLIEFILEFLRTLLIEELSGHVRKGIPRLLVSRRPNSLRKALAGIHHRNRERLLHKLRTGEAGDS